MITLRLTAAILHFFVYGVWAFLIIRLTGIWFFEPFTLSELTQSSALLGVMGAVIQQIELSREEDKMMTPRKLGYVICPEPGYSAIQLAEKYGLEIENPRVRIATSTKDFEMFNEDEWIFLHVQPDEDYKLPPL